MTGYPIKDQTVKNKVTAMKDPKSLLRDIIVPYMRSRQLIMSGRERPEFGQKPREIIANWLICAVANYQAGKNEWTFSNDPEGGDGVIVSRSTGDGWRTEHVIALQPEHLNDDSAATRLVLAVEHKNKRGDSYAKGSYLVIFAEGLGSTFNPNEVSQRIRGQHAFESVWAVGLQEAEQNEHRYWVTCFDERPCPCLMVTVNLERAEWSVEQIL